MKPLILSAIATSTLFVLAMTTSVAAQDPAAAAAAIPPVQAPPALDDPGTPASKTVALPTPEAQARAAVIDTQGAADASLPAEKPLESPGLPAEVQAAANAAELPVVTVRQQGTDTVEEYRKHGKLVLVRVLSNNGPTRLYIDNPTDLPPNMQQLSGPSGVVQPVYYKLFEWK
jgi:Protein of unknown function (DUF2782)